MSLFDQLGEAIHSEFSSRRSTVPRVYIYAPDAALRMAEAIACETSGRRVLALFDARTRQIAGLACMQALRAKNFEVLETLVPDSPDGTSPVCDDITKARVAKTLPSADILVAVGSGVINDLTKWLAAEAGLPYAVFATAASMNGYSAANVAPTINGIKSLFRANAPRIIAACPSIIENAPPRLNASGLGDLIAKPVSTADWVLNHSLFGEAYSQSIADIINRTEPQYILYPERLANKHPEAIRSLFDALIFSGCAMTLQGSSLPASGGEHLISHTLDMFSHVDGHPHDLHGRQVGVATIFAAAVYERILSLSCPNFSEARLHFDPKVWGPIASSVEQEWTHKQERLAETCRKLRTPGTWDALKGQLAPLLRHASSIKTCLKGAAAAHTLADIGCPKERFLLAAKHCATMRSRVTSVDLGFICGVLPDQAEAIVDEWLVD